MNNKMAQRLARIATFGAEHLHQYQGIVIEPEDLGLTEDECDLLEGLEEKDPSISKIRKAQRNRICPDTSSNG